MIASLNYWYLGSSRMQSWNRLFLIILKLEREYASISRLQIRSRGFLPPRADAEKLLKQTLSNSTTYSRVEAVKVFCFIVPAA